CARTRPLLLSYAMDYW
nr:immunoglobulin heavy chain junction region [Mus musculus]